MFSSLYPVLTKRAIALVKNKSLYEAQRGVVTTHVFTSFLHADSQERLLSGTECVDALELHPFNFRNHSDYVAETLEAHLQKQSVKNSQARDVTTGTEGRGKQLSATQRDEYLQLSLSDIFTAAKHSKTSPSRHIPVDFQSNLEKFRSELEATIARYSSSSRPAVHAPWDADVPPEETDTTAAKETHDPLLENSSVRNAVHADLSKSPLSDQKVIMRSHRNLDDDLESFRDGPPALPAPYQALDPYNRSLENDPDEEADFDSQIPFNGHLLPDFSKSVGPSPHVDSAIVNKPSALEPIDLVTDVNILNKGGKQAKKLSKNSKKLAESERKSKAKKCVDKKVKQKKGSVGAARDSKQKVEHMNVLKELQELTEKSFVDVSCFTNSVSCYFSLLSIVVTGRMCVSLCLFVDNHHV